MEDIKCPNCGSTRVAAEVKAWANFEDGEPVDFDYDDVAYVEPINGGWRVCRDCEHLWNG